MRGGGGEYSEERKSFRKITIAGITVGMSSDQAILNVRFFPTTFLSPNNNYLFITE